ncbi:MAG: hypothetical protein ACR2P7_03680 [bacterium]
MRAADGRAVLFVGRPSDAPADERCLYAHPDDRADDGASWRDALRAYNETHRRTGANPLGLLPAYQLYAPDCYRALTRKLGVDNVYILSAGWGLIAADFLTPDYNITFSNSAPAHARRGKRDRYDDFRLLAKESTAPLLYFGGVSYQWPFLELTAGYRGQRICFYNSAAKPTAPGVIYVRYQSAAKTNWHYLCVADFIADDIAVPS